MTATPRFPELMKVYYDRAKTARKKKLIGLAISLAVVIATAPATEHAKYQIYFFVAACFSIYFGLKLTALYHGLRSFHNVWEDHLSEVLTDPSMLPLFESVDRELEGETSRYTDVIFTQRYVITFKRLGSFALVRAITDVWIDLRQPMPHGFSLVTMKPYYEMSCDVEPLGRVVLSKTGSEMPDIIEEIRYRNPSVRMSEHSMDLLEQVS